MTLLDMQRVFSRILTDKAFQRAFTDGTVPDPDTYQLTGRELSSLRSLRWDRVTLHADLLAHGRLELALKPLPLTSLVLGEQLHAHLDRFCAEYPPVPGPGGQLYLEANRICDFAVRLLGEGALHPVWAADLIGYERVLMTMASSAEVAASAAEVARLNEQQAAGDISDLIPVAGPHVTVLSFGSPLPDLLPTLDEGVKLVSVPRLIDPLLVLFHKVPYGPVRLVKVNAPAAALIEACDGERTVTEVTRLISRRFGPRIEANAVGALGWLREAGVLGLRREN